jgi:LysR family transcriptional regulator, low CO2-responsive transcriptional regulator
MNYTLNQLRIFYKITQTKSITKAANELHLTQPAVSIQLKNFQNQFEIPLTETVNKKIYITDFGYEIAIAAEKILDEAMGIQDKLMSFKGKLTGKLKLSTVSTGKYVLPYFLSVFLKQNPGINLVLDVTNRQKVTENLEKNEIDFGLTSMAIDSLRLENIEMLKNQLVLVGSPTLKSEKWTNPEPAFLQEVPLIYREKGSGTRYIMEEYIASHGLNVNQKLELTSNEAVKQATIAGLGYSIVPMIGIKNELQLGQLEVIQMKDLPIISTWNLVWPIGKKITPIMSAFINFIESEKSQIIEQYFPYAKFI